MKVKSILKKISTVAFLLCAIVAMSFSVSADTESNSVNNAKDGIVLVNLVYVENSVSDPIVIQSGTGFLINEDTVITCYHVTHFDDSNIDWAEMERELGEGAQKKFKERLKIQVIALGDAYVYATNQDGRNSARADFDILTLQTPILNRSALTLGDSDSLDVTKDIYALGFPATATMFQNAQSFADSNTYTSAEVSVTNGKPSKLSTRENVAYIQHTATISEGNSGGPLIDSNGNVIGINQQVVFNSDDGVQYFYSVAINQLKQTLDTFGIEYGSGNEINVDPVLDSETEAEGVTESAETEPATITPETTASKAEKEGTNMVLIVGIIVAVVVVIIIIVIIIILVTGNKKRKPPYQVAGGSTPLPPSGGNGAKSSGTYPVNDGSNATTVLNDGSGETTVLGANGGQTTAILLRMKTGEKISINKGEFIIGKEKRRVDYCISNNTSVSRCHTKIITRGSQHFIMDMNSTNFTFINGNKLTPNKEIALFNGDKIMVSDEEFEFRSL